MNTTKKIGDYGEELACSYLKTCNYAILEQNFRFRRGEIDIICQKENMLIFVEVKFRSSSNFGFPEEVVGDSKIALIQLVAEHYLELIDWKKDIRFDIISIIENNTKTDIKHFKDVF